MVILSKAPLRLGLAGGGTDVSPYSDIFGGATLNATINMYAHAYLEPTNNGKIVFGFANSHQSEEFVSTTYIEPKGDFLLQKGVFNRIVKDYVKKPLSFKLTSCIDAPSGSGLGSSSTLAVAVLTAFAKWLNIKLDKYDLAKLAYSIEREDLQMAGGKQDQYATIFGGFNFMSYFGDKVVVTPLKISQQTANNFANNLILYYTETNRQSAKIIELQQQNVKSNVKQSLEAMHKVKEQTFIMRDVLLNGNIDKIGEILDQSWKYKKQMAEGISNERIDNIYSTAIQNGASGGKISGAGGGGFMFFYCPNNSRQAVVEALTVLGGEVRPYMFVYEGVNIDIIDNEKN